MPERTGTTSTTGEGGTVAGWRLLDRTENMIAALSAFALLGVVLLISADVFGRRLWGWSIPWIIEVAEYYLLFATFMNSAWVLRQGGHIEVEFFTKLGVKGKRRLQGIAHILTLLTVLFVLYFTTQTVITYIQRGSIQGNFLVMPQWLVFAPIPVGLTLFLIELIRQIRRYIATPETA